MDLEFGNYRLKAADRLLLGPHGPVELSARSFDILAMLLEKPDKVIGKAELFEGVWPGLVVEENTLQVHISALRKALQAGMIMTVHGRGYKYAGPKPFVATSETQERAKASIAILPFNNMSGDPDQDHLVDGISEDIISELSRFRDILVIARNSSFQFRGKANDIAEVVKKLGVQYVVEGSVRKSGNRIRVSAQLIDASSTAHVWAEHYDRELDDIFAIQDEITQMISARLARQARTAIASRTRSRPTASAYENYVQALHLASDHNTVTLAEPYLQRAVELDPRFTSAHALLSFVTSAKYNWSNDPRHLESALRIAQVALQLDAEEAYAHLASGYALICMRRLREAEPILERAVALNPNDPFILSIRALLLNYLGRSDEAIAELAQAQRRDPFAVGWFEDFLGIILTGAGRYREALASYARMATIQSWSLVCVAVCHAALGEMKQAKLAIAKLGASYPQLPGMTLDEILELEIFYEDPAILERYRTILQRVDNRD
jgi:TolB-like protein